MPETILPKKPSSPSALPPTLILGAGRLGTALAQSFLSLKQPLLGLWNRNIPQHRHPDLPYDIGPTPTQKLEQAELVLLTVSDAAIPEVAMHLLSQQAFQPGQVVLHCSGRCSSNVLQPLQDLGCEIGRMHPLQPVTQAPPQGALFQGAAVGVEGTTKAHQLATEVAQQLGGQAFSLQGSNPALYHAAAVMASNYVVTLAHIATQLMRASGVIAPPLPLLLPLMKLAVNNLEQQGLPEALTGPISRGDLSTLEEHLNAFQKEAPELTNLYVQLAEATLPLAQAQEHNNNDDPTWDTIQEALLHYRSPH